MCLVILHNAHNFARGFFRRYRRCLIFLAAHIGLQPARMEDHDLAAHHPQMIMHQGGLHIKRCLGHTITVHVNPLVTADAAGFRGYVHN
ncbi:hypothetical protein D3C75_1095240 [compost metagenome]